MENLKNMNEKTNDELREELVHWIALNENGEFMLNQVKARIARSKMEMSRKYKPSKEDNANLNMLQAILVETKHNYEISADMISSIKEELRNRVKKEMVDFYKASLAVAEEKIA
jgi:signal recognition particle GTPase